MKLADKHGKVALITGASSGIGEAFAKRLAAEGCDLVLVARRLDRLQALSEQLAGQYSTKSHIIACDLTAPDSGEQVQSNLVAAGISVDILVNNAGFGVLGDLESIDRSKSLGMVDLNCRAVVDLTHRFLPKMKDNRRGAVIIVSSVVGALPAPWFAVYAATKAFDLCLGEALHSECSDTGVSVVTVMPGLTSTEFQAGAGMRDYHSPYRTPENVVNSALKALGKKAIVADGWYNKLLVHGTRFVPRAMLLMGSRAVMKAQFKKGRQNL
jgi:short-subunit dehydrogenase